MSVFENISICVVPDADDNEYTTQDTEAASVPPEMKSMHVVSNIRNRYARTVVTSKYFNEDMRAQEATFSIVLPDTAFIAGFVMEIKGKKYEAYVKEKEEAKQEYNAAVSSGRAAAHVAVSARDSNKFTVSANVEPQSDVTFILTYEELLVRKHSKYDVVINLHPTQLIDDFQVDVYINETRPIINVEMPALRSGNEIITEVTRNEYATINKDEDGVVHVGFKPTIDQQMKMAEALEAERQKTEEFSTKEKTNRISGQFIVQYDVERDPLGGEVLVNDGYFVHFFAPTDLKPIPKHVIFILDVSGSMSGTKLKQLKEALIAILDELNPKDYFNLVKFSDNISVLNSKFTWDKVEIPTESQLPKSFEVSDKNIRSVKTVIKLMTDECRTNIYDALIVGLRMTSKGISHLSENDKHKPQPIIVFLTDGQPNVSVSHPDKIIEMVRNKNNTEIRSAIFALAFGADADAKFLKELAIQNSGFNRHIYEAADASLQLQDFYKQISSPLLTNVNFKYTGELKQVKDLTRHNFEILFNGSEFVVSGKIDEMVDDFVFVEASTLNGSNKFYPTITNKPNNISEYGSLERLWAYMTIKQLLDKKFEKKNNCEQNVSNNPCDKDNTEKQTEFAEKQALQLALKYSFVTPVTSLVVVKPDEPSVAENTDALQHSSNMACDTSNTSYRTCFDLDDDYVMKSPRCMKKKIMKRKLKICPSIISTEVEEQCPIEDLSENKGNSVKLGRIQVACNVSNQIASITEERTYQSLSTNPEDVSYSIILPEDAIVTQFYLKEGAKSFEGIGLFETEAQNEYQTAISSSLEAALINLQDSNKVTVNIHIMPGNEVTLVLHYQKYLENKNNKYDLRINLQNEKFIENVAVIITLVEKEKSVIKNILHYLKHEDKIIENKHATVNKPENNFATIEFCATKELQEEIAKDLGTANKFSCEINVEYQVDPSSAIQKSESNFAIALTFPYIVAVKAKKIE